MTDIGSGILEKLNNIWDVEGALGLFYLLSSNPIIWSVETETNKFSIVHKGLFDKSVSNVVSLHVFLLYKHVWSLLILLHILALSSNILM